MWPEVISTGVVAVLAGGLMVPAVRNRTIGAVSVDWLGDELELDGIEEDGATVRLKDGTLFRVYSLHGQSYDAKVMAEQENLIKRRAALFHQLGELGLGLRLFAVKRRRPISYEAQWPCQTLAHIGEREQQAFTEAFQVAWFLVISGRSAKALHDANGKIRDMIADYRPRLVSCPDDVTQPCPLTGFLNYLISGDLRHDLPPISRALSGSLPGSDLTILQESGVIETHTPIRHLQRVIAIREWPEQVDGRILTQVIAKTGDLEVSQICEPLARDMALALFKRKEVEQRAALIGNPTAADEAAAVSRMLVEGNTTLFFTQLQIILRAETEAALDRLTEQVAAVLGRNRVLFNVETVGAPICWFNRLPRRLSIKPTGNGLYRPLMLREENIAGLWVFPDSANGLMTSPFGQAPVRFFRTPSGQAYAFQFHVADEPQSRGNFLVIAPTGGGKTTLMMHLLGGLAKFEGVKSFLFDSKDGARYMVEALGGTYQSYDKLALNPLDVGEDTPGTRHRIYAILRAMVGNMDLDDDGEEALSHAIDMAFTVAPPERTLNNVFEFAFAKRSDLRRSFAKWVTDGKGNKGLLSHVFNAPHDSLGGMLSQSHLVGINMNEALDDPELGPPVVAHIAQAIGDAAKSLRGFTIFIDEAAKLLQNEGFRNLAAEMFREYRKKDGCVGLAFQDPAALYKSGAAEAFIENTATFLFLPNSQASAESLAPFHLNDEQIAFVCGSERREGERQVLIVKRDAARGLDESAIIDVNLAYLGDALRYYRSGDAANREMRNLQSLHGERWHQHILGRSHEHQQD